MDFLHGIYVERKKKFKKSSKLMNFMLILFDKSLFVVGMGLDLVISGNVFRNCVERHVQCPQK